MYKSLNGGAKQECPDEGAQAAEGTALRLTSGSQRDLCHQKVLCVITHRRLKRNEKQNQLRR